MQPVDIAQSLQIHHRFVSYTMTTRHGSNDEAFKTALNEFDFPPASIFYHGVHSLYRMVKLIEDPDLHFREIPFYRKNDVSITDELLSLYSETIEQFVEKLELMSDEDLENEILSPLSGKSIKLKDWFAQSIMHCIHHIGQAVRIQGMVDRKLTNHPADYDTASDYTNLFD